MIKYKQEKSSDYFFTEKTPSIRRNALDDGRGISTAYKRPMTKKGVIITGLKYQQTREKRKEIAGGF